MYIFIICYIILIVILLFDLNCKGWFLLRMFGCFWLVVDVRDDNVGDVNVIYAVGWVCVDSFDNFANMMIKIAKIFK